MTLKGEKRLVRFGTVVPEQPGCSLVVINLLSRVEMGKERRRSKMAGTWETTRGDDVFASEIIVEVCDPGHVVQGSPLRRHCVLGSSQYTLNWMLSSSYNIGLLYKDDVAVLDLH